MKFKWKVRNQRYGETELVAETCLEALKAAAEQWGCEKWTDIAYSSEIETLGIEDDTSSVSCADTFPSRGRQIGKDLMKNGKDEHDGPRGRGAGNADELGSNAGGEIPGAGNAVSHTKRRAQKRSGSGKV